MKKLIVITLSLSALFVARAEVPKNPLEVQLKDAKGAVKGTAVLTPVPEGVKIALNAEGLSKGAHGFHIHETGTCTAPDFKSAGGHFNPSGHPHGHSGAGEAHNGDMSNIQAGADGRARTEFINHAVTLGEGANSLRKAGGTALVVHAKADDYKTQPTGDSGDRVLCGEIKAAK